MLKNNKGITLVSLVITIIILIIIASVATVSGVGAVNYIKFNNAKSQFQTMQSHVNSWYEESKNNVDVLSYGAELTEADVTKVNQTLNGRDKEGYRYFTSDYIKNTLDIDGISYDFLINISSRTVLLFGGITYENQTYYSAEDFGINVIEYEELSGDITFDTVVEDGDIIVYNIQFSEDIDISKYSVQYQERGDTYWTTLTSDMKVIYTYEKQNEDGEIQEIIDSNAWKTSIVMPRNLINKYYNIRIITDSDKIISSKEITVSWKGIVTKNKRILADATNQKTIAVPKGFYILDYIEESPINRGVVVVAPDGSEFVWIPVNDVTKMAKEISGVDDNGRANYQGKLYEFTSTSATEMTDYGQGTISYREPSLVTQNSADTYAVMETVTGTVSDASSDYYNTILGYDSAVEFGKDMQEDYNEMIESVKENKGFYIGRYETSLNSSENAQSVSGETSASAIDSSSKYWYGLYRKEKEYSSENNLAKVVGSSMMWGSQYDQMIIWMQENGIDVTSTTPTNLEGITTSKNTSGVTGSVDTDKLNNIYDLLGGRREWTLEANNIYYRVFRGGSYGVSDSPSYRKGLAPDNYNGAVSSRFTLYLK